MSEQTVKKNKGRAWNSLVVEVPALYAWDLEFELWILSLVPKTLFGTSGTSVTYVISITEHN